MEIVCYGTDGKILEVLTVTTKNPKAAICYEAGKFWQASFCGSCGNKGIASIIQINRSIGVLLSTMSWMYFGIAIALCAVNSNTSEKMIEQLGNWPILEDKQE